MDHVPIILKPILYNINSTVDYLCNDAWILGKSVAHITHLRRVLANTHLIANEIMEQLRTNTGTPLHPPEDKEFGVVDGRPIIDRVHPPLAVNDKYLTYALAFTVGFHYLSSIDICLDSSAEKSKH